MACPTVFDRLKLVAESLGTKIYKNAAHKSIWLNIIPRDTYKNGTGVVQTTFTTRAVEPTSTDEAWTVPAPGTYTTGGTCATTYTEVDHGYDEDTYKVEKMALKGRTICSEQLEYLFNVESFLADYFENLTLRARRAWENRYESIYLQLASKAVTGTTMIGNISDTVGKPYTGSTGLLDGTSVVALSSPGSKLTQDHLDEIAYELIDRGATDPDKLSYIELGPEGPVWPLLIDPMASKMVINSTDSGKFRTDLNYGAPNEVLKRIGATRTLKNFRHVPNMCEPRFGYGSTVNTVAITGGGTTFDVANASAALWAIGMPVTSTTTSGVAIGSSAVITGLSVGASNTTVTVSVAHTGSGTQNVNVTVGTAGQLYRIQPYLSNAATNGYKSERNPGWKEAPIGCAIVLNPRVFTSEVVKPVTSAAGVSWSPRNYMGEWKWVQGGEKITSTNDCYDPLGKYGAHFAEFKHAPRPEFPLHGMSIFYLRCPAGTANVTC